MFFMKQKNPKPIITLALDFLLKFNISYFTSKNVIYFLEDIQFHFPELIQNRTS